MVSGSALNAIVQDYRSYASTRADEDAWWRAKDESIDGAIDRAARARTRRGRHSHQRRQSAATLAECARRLKAIAGELAACRTFHDLFLRVERALQDIPGVGELVIYDTADRIGHHLALSPDRIYLHRGTREGALALVNGLKRADQSITIEQLPIELQVLANREAEDVLCSYKAVLHGRASSLTDASSCTSGSRGRGASRVC
jgi:hypothetical protein